MMIHILWIAYAHMKTWHQWLVVCLIFDYYILLVKSKSNPPNAVWYNIWLPHLTSPSSDLCLLVPVMLIKSHSRTVCYFYLQETELNFKILNFDNSIIGLDGITWNLLNRFEETKLSWWRRGSASIRILEFLFPRSLVLISLVIVVIFFRKSENFLNVVSSCIAVLFTMLIMVKGHLHVSWGGIDFRAWLDNNSPLYNTCCALLPEIEKG